MTRKGMVLPAGSKWVGSCDGGPVNLDPGYKSTSAEAASESTIKPFGRAHNMGLAPYHVVPGWGHGLIWAVFQNSAVSFRAITLTMSLALATAMLRASGRTSGEYSLVLVSAKLVPVFVVVQNLATLLFLVVDVACKWIIMGRRYQGRFNWDESDYCQRWQIYLASSAFIRSAYAGRGILDYLRGSAYLVWYFRLLGAKIGRDVCLYPKGADPMMTEPDLVRIGDEACIDNASIIAHINTQGQFSLNTVVVGQRVTLRSFSRVLSGAVVMEGATLLEHTLILSGDVVDAYTTCQAMRF
mmetsp:Transcript_39328/g.104313  ORF Transcript_39328/g.104313 Transcript_39328/m.104313 type:complete len:298 (+) Transcript_39328:1984-2877(+)